MEQNILVWSALLGLGAHCPHLAAAFCYFGERLICWGPGMNPGLGYNGVCTASSTIIFPVPGVLTFVLISP
jgi:hypothetical protein